jgi:hypothetical protein
VQHSFDMKLVHALSLLDSLGTVVDEYMESNPYRIAVECHPNEQKYSFWVEELAEVPLAWSLVVGDVVHNARCALDHAIFELALRHKGSALTEKEERATSFPYYSREAEFRDWARKLGGLIPEDVRMLLESLQPYNSENYDLWGHFQLEAYGTRAMLTLLLKLDNIDKHRFVRLPGFAMNTASDSLIPVLPEPFEATPLLVEGYIRSGDHLGDWLMGTSSLPEVPPVTELKPYFPIHLTLGEQFTEAGDRLTVEHADAIRTLANCWRTVAAVIALLRPVITGQGNALDISQLATLFTQDFWELVRAIPGVEVS